MVRLFRMSTMSGGTHGGKAIYLQTHIPVEIGREMGWSDKDRLSWLYETELEKLVQEIRDLAAMGHQVVVVKKI